MCYSKKEYKKSKQKAAPFSFAKRFFLERLASLCENEHSEVRILTKRVRAKRKAKIVKKKN